MSAERLFDTNILIYAITPADRRNERAAALLAEGGRVGVQALNEFANVARRKLLLEWDQIEQQLDLIRALCGEPIPITFEIHQQALRIARAYRYSVYDSLVIAAALAGGCSRLLSEDMSHGQTIDGKLTIINPFAPA